MISEIFLPMFYMMLLTLIVFSLSLSLRLKEIYLDKKVSGEEQRHPPFDQGSNLLKNAQRNLSNLFEFPVFFYAICICIYITDSTDELFVTLAYWFFYFRIIHSIYHIFFNQLIFTVGIPIRALLWVPGIVIMVWMWVRFIYFI